MNKQEILDQSTRSAKPVVVDFWAPWCVPCKMMAPALEHTAKAYSGSVDLLRINADEHQQAVKDFGIMGIPTVLVISNGQEISRHTGSLNAEQLDILFKAASTNQDILIPPTRSQRITRIVSGLALLAMGYIWGSGIILYPLGAFIIFAAMYDRCPIFKMLFPKIKSLFRSKSAEV
ncbi:MAG TPA: thioredoxin [Leptolinea sp.]